MWPSCQVPYISLPTAQNRSVHGSLCPLAARSLPIGVSAAPTMYWTSAAASSTVPLPMFSATYGSALIKSQSSMNSWMPTSLLSMFFHAGLARGGRLSGFGSIPSRQLYPETKFPPGHRSSGVLSFFSSSSVSARHPFTLSAGIREIAPIRKEPLPLAVMLSVT